MEDSDSDDESESAPLLEVWRGGMLLFLAGGFESPSSMVVISSKGSLLLEVRQEGMLEVEEPTVDFFFRSDVPCLDRDLSLSDLVLPMEESDSND